MVGRFWYEKGKGEKINALDILMENDEMIVLVSLFVLRASRVHYTHLTVEKKKKCIRMLR